MKKFLFPILCFVTAAINCFSQTFFSLGTGVNSGPGLPFLFADTSTNILYTAGWITSIGNVSVQGTARWNGLAWDSMGYGTLGSGPRAMVKYNGEIILGGSYGSRTSSANGRGLSKWNGTAWVPFADAIDSSGSGEVYGLLVHNNDLFVFGAFDSIAGMRSNMIARWDGVSWYTYPDITEWGGGWQIYDAAFYNNELYVGGNFEFPYPGIRGDIAKWNGTAWQQVDTGLSGSLSSVGALEVYNNELWVGGGFETNWGDPGNYLMKWNGTNWTQLSCEPNGFVYDLKVYGGKMYAGGTFNVPSITNGWWSARWFGTQCESYGIFDNGPVNSFAELNGELYIGGGFETVNGDTMNRITRYDGVVGINADEKKGQVNIIPNPSSGTFTVNLPTINNRSYDIEIYNGLGEKIRSQNTFGKTQIDLSDKPKGIYFVRIINQEEISTRKIIIQ